MEGQDRPVRNARLTYALIGGLTVEQVEAITSIDVRPLIKEVIGAYGDLNKHVHGREGTIVRDLDEQDAIAHDVLVDLAQLLEAQRDYRREIVDGIADGLQREAVEAFTTETISGRVPRWDRVPGAIDRVPPAYRSISRGISSTKLQGR